MKGHIVHKLLRVVIAIILIQTLRYKFTAHPDSVYIFTKVGLEPFGRIGIGVAELLASILILIPKTVWLGSGMVLGILAGAIVMHLTMIGIEVNGDSGLLFYTAIATFVLSAISLWLVRSDIPLLNLK